MTDLDQTLPQNSKSKGKVLFVLVALSSMIIVAVGLNYSNSQKREEFKKKIEQIKVTDSKFVKNNDCWLLDQKPNEKLNADSVQFFSSNSSDKKNFHYKCPVGRGYESNIYVGSQDAQYLSKEEKQQLMIRLETQ